MTPLIIVVVHSDLTASSVNTDTFGWQVAIMTFNPQTIVSSLKQKLMSQWHQLYWISDYFWKSNYKQAEISQGIQFSYCMFFYCDIIYFSHTTCAADWMYKENWIQHWRQDLIHSYERFSVEHEAKMASLSRAKVPLSGTIERGPWAGSQITRYHKND